MTAFGIIMFWIMVCAWWSPKGTGKWAAEFMLAYYAQVPPKKSDINIKFAPKEDA
jgi:hypothetical protein